MDLQVAIAIRKNLDDWQVLWVYNTRLLKEEWSSGRSREQGVAGDAEGPNRALRRHVSFDIIARLKS
jgi:hypothetical protein